MYIHIYKAHIAKAKFGINDACSELLLLARTNLTKDPTPNTPYNNTITPTNIYTHIIY